MLVVQNLKGYILSEEQQARFNFINPCKNYLDGGYQICNAYIAINNGVTYYNKYGSGSSAKAPVLKLSYADDCTLPSNYTGSEYSLRARLAAGNWSSAPTYEELASNSLSNKFSIMFDNKGDRGPPCGVPIVVSS